MKIGELSRSTDTKVTTIRFYEEIGLLNRPARTASGRRTYTTGDVERLNFVRNGRRLGFSIEEIRSLIALASEPNRDCGEAMTIASCHLAAVEERLEQLTALRDELAVMSRDCDRQRIADCRVIHTIARPVGSPISIGLSTARAGRAMSCEGHATAREASSAASSRLRRSAFRSE